MYWHRFFVWLLDELFPRACLGCKQEGIDACDRCLRSLPIKPVWVKFDGLSVWSAYDYNESGVGRYIQAWKYRGVQHFLHSWLAMIPWPDCEADIVIAVPLHKRKLLERGFNQAELIASALAVRFGLPISKAHRRRFTKPQALCDGEERRRNVKRAFAVEAASIAGKRVVLVDDVVTTGSTLQELAAVLRAAGARDIRAICLARGGK